MSACKRFLGFLLLSALTFQSGFIVYAQTPFLDKENSNAKQEVSWECYASKNDNYKVGDVFTVFFKGTVIAEGWHLYSPVPPPNGMGYQPTVFEFDKDVSQDIEKIGQMSADKKPRVFYDDIMLDTIREFKEHVVTYAQRFKITGPHPKLTGEFIYQVCENMCIYDNMEVTYSLKVNNTTDDSPPTPKEPKTPSSETLSAENSSKIDSSMASGGPKIEHKDPAELNPDTSSSESAITGITAKPPKNCDDVNYWLLFLKAFLLGFGAVLTPCVFPMIPLTVSFFTKQSENRAKGIRNALLYGFFIISIYTILGISLAMIFGDDVMYKMATNPWVNLGFFVMLFVFALSFLGMFEITLPSSWANAADSRSERGGIIGIFFMALTLAVVSFSCTGPLVGTALIEAAEGCQKGPIIAMLGFSSAIAIPFGLFAIFPGWLNSLPSSGGWLNSVKVVLGMLEIALGMKFLSQADLYLKWHILDREIFIGAWIVIFALLGLYLLGKIRLPHDSKVENLSVPRFILASVTFWFVLYLVPGLWGAQLPLISGILPPPNADIGVKVLGAKEMNEGTINGKICSLDSRKYYDIFEEKETHGFCTFYDLEEAIEFAKKENKPLFMDFTGHTCANCREMEQKVWHKPEVDKLLKTEYVMVSLYADEITKLAQPEKVGVKKVTRMGQKWLALQRKYYGTYAQPYYVLFDPYLDIDNPKSSLTTPSQHTKYWEEYRDFLKAGVIEFERRHKK